jgi:hypothetical protein
MVKVRADITFGGKNMKKGREKGKVEKKEEKRENSS